MDFVSPATASSNPQIFAGAAAVFEFAPEFADATAPSIEHMLQGLTTLSFPFVIFSEALVEREKRETLLKCRSGKRG
jgi:hypothetical protein